MKFVGKPYMEVELAPVIDDEEATAVARHTLADHKPA